MSDESVGLRPLGFAALAMGFWMFGMIHAGWFSQAVGTGGTVQWIWAFGGVAFTLAAADEVLRGDSDWHAVLFGLFAAFTWGGYLAGDRAVSAFAGWWLVLLAVILFYAWLAARRRGLDSVTGYFTLAASLGVVLAASGYVPGYGIVETVSGYVYMIAALLAFWRSASLLMGQAPEPAATGTEAGGGETGF